MAVGHRQYAAQVLADNPLALYQFDETSGTVMADSSGNGRDGTYVNSPALGQNNILADDSGYSANFEATSSQRADVAYGSWMDVSAMTVITTGIVVTSGLRIIASRYTDVGNDWSWFLYTNNNKFLFYYRSSGGTNYQIDSGVTVSNTKKYFVAAYVGASGAGLRVYDENGVVATATGPGVTLNPSSRNLVIADCDPPNHYYMIGYLDGLAYFGSALSASRLDQLAGYALNGATKWLQRSPGVLSRNGTTSHTLSFAPSGNGSLLVAVISTPGVSTATTPGWTKRVGVYYDTELSVFTRTANAGDANLTLSISDSNVPLHYVVYEFPSGSSWHSSATSTYSGLYPPLSGLPGVSTMVFAAVSTRRLAAEPATPGVDWQYFWDTDMVQETSHDGVTTGVFTGIGYIPTYRQTTVQPTQYNEYVETDVSSGQRVLFALNIL